MSRKLKEKILRSSNQFLNTLYKIKEPIKSASVLKDHIFNLDKNIKRFLNLIEIYNNRFKKEEIVFKRLEFVTLNNINLNMMNQFNNYFVKNDKISSELPKLKQNIIENNDNFSDSIGIIDDKSKIEFYRYKNEYNNFFIIYNKINGVLSIETGYMELDSICFDIINTVDNEFQIRTIENLLNLYWDIGFRKCDICMLFYNVNFEIPLCRKIDGDFIEASHKKCKI